MFFFGDTVYNVTYLGKSGPIWMIFALYLRCGVRMYSMHTD